MFDLIHYEHRWEFFAGWALLVAWIATLAFTATFATVFFIAGEPNWLSMAVLGAFAIAMIVRSIRELRLNHGWSRR